MLGLANSAQPTFCHASEGWHPENQKGVQTLKPIEITFRAIILAIIFTIFAIMDFYGDKYILDIKYTR